MIFDLEQEDFDNLKKLTELSSDKQDEIIDEAIEVVNLEKK